MKARPGSQRAMFDLPAPLYAAAKLEARRQGRAMRDVIVLLLAEWVKAGPRWQRFLSRAAGTRAARRPALRKSRRPR